MDHISGFPIICYVCPTHSLLDYVLKCTTGGPCHLTMKPPPVKNEHPISPPHHPIVKEINANLPLIHVFTHKTGLLGSIPQSISSHADYLKFERKIKLLENCWKPLRYGATVQMYATLRRSTYNINNIFLFCWKTTPHVLARVYTPYTPYKVYTPPSLPNF